MLLLTIDPNIYRAALLGHEFSLDLLSHLEEAWAQIQIAFDEEGLIEAAYDDLLKLIQGGKFHCPIPGSDEAVERYLSQLLQDDAFIKISSSVTNSEKRLLQALHCHTSVEPQLIAISTKPKFACRLLVVGKYFQHTMIEHRCTHDQATVSTLRKTFPDLDVRDVLYAKRSLSDWLDKLLYPSTQVQLEHFLRDNPEESRTVEYKQSGKAHLTRSILEQTMEEICALANTTGGRVLLGVNEIEEKGNDGRKIRKYRLDGFEAKYQSSKGKIKFFRGKSDVADNLYQDPKLLPKFKPRFEGDELQFNVIELANKNWVLVIHVKQCPDIRYYGSHTYRREGTQSKRYPYPSAK